MSTATHTDAFAREWADWHREHERRRTDPHGFLAVTGLHWLTTDAARIPGVPGEWSTGPSGPVVVLAADETLTLDGTALSGRHAFGPLAERDGLTVAYEGGVAEVAKRGGHDIVRPRRPDHPFLAAYAGTPAYAPDARWRVDAEFVADPRPAVVGSALDGIEHVYDSPGRLSFELDGQELSLVALPGRAGDLLVLFTDGTSGDTTYPANRALSAPAPDADGRTVLDFTRATNLPCAYTDFATCPLPPAGNRLPLRVEAGERTPVDRVRADAPLSAPVAASA